VNNIEAANLAISRVGHGTLRAIVALDDDNPAAQAVSRVFTPVLRMMLSEFSWPFARACAALALNPGDAPSGWAYSYAMPANALSVRYVEADGFVPEWIARNDQLSRWEVMADPASDGQIIVTDTASAFAFYTKAITELAFTSEPFSNAFAWRVASEIALGLEAQPQFAQLAKAEYNLALDIAVSQAMNQHGGWVRTQAESVQVRDVNTDCMGVVLPVLR
jgi:hypothetical protein